MILAVCLNPAVDVTYSVAALRYGTSHRIAAVHRRAGGKGVNVARVLAQVGEPVAVCGFAGGGTGRWLRDELAGSGVADRLTGIDGETRQSVAVVDEADATVFNEPGPPVRDADFSGLADTFEQQLAGCAAVVMSGSVPPGAPVDAYARLVLLARRHGVPTVVDTSGAQLRSAADAGATVLAPNRDEVGVASGDPAALLEAAAELSRRSGGTAVVSAGRDGLVAVDGEHHWRALPPRQVTGNPTGAGDALSAGLARGLAHGSPWPLVLADSLALAAAAVAAPVAGQVELSLYRELAAVPTVEEVPCP
ncbi:hexose kinase [Actinoplanes sp. TBRC 11911]|uniref:1-phosphofructokinase family hexose kinase n=1 Tax=Actinoplanes sp. TBRC 11911 TaxID=2729386 RepID=UPI00145C674A|nr:hexose kinase [Actinoplanes sp. TBRC 11911]NMO54560.1 hexose kinase [Actinoplanes sp. TBRC 11911]